MTRPATSSPRQLSSLLLALFALWVSACSERALTFGERLEAGALDHDAVLGLLRDGDVAAFELALGMHAKLEPVRVRRLAYHDDRRHLAALCIRAGVPTPHYVTIRMALELAGRSVQPNLAKDDSYSSEAMQYLQHQYERLRLDEVVIEELIEGV